MPTCKAQALHCVRGLCWGGKWHHEQPQRSRWYTALWGELYLSLHTTKAKNGTCTSCARTCASGPLGILSSEFLRDTGELPSKSFPYFLPWKIWKVRKNLALILGTDVKTCEYFSPGSSVTPAGSVSFLSPSSSPSSSLRATDNGWGREESFFSSYLESNKKALNLPLRQKLQLFFLCVCIQTFPLISRLKLTGKDKKLSKTVCFKLLS